MLVWSIVKPQHNLPGPSITGLDDGGATSWQRLVWLGRCRCCSMARGGITHDRFRLGLAQQSTAIPAKDVDRGRSHAGVRDNRAECKAPWSLSSLRSSPNANGQDTAMLTDARQFNSPLPLYQFILIPFVLCNAGRVHVCRLMDVVISAELRVLRRHTPKHTSVPHWTPEAQTAFLRP